MKSATLHDFVKPMVFGFKLGVVYTTTSPKDRRIGRWVKNQLVDMGPMYIKMGQIVSSRSDVFPRYITDELATLRTKVPSASFDDVRRVLEEENIFDEFESVNKKPLASASIGQLHLAKLKISKKIVAVKILKPVAYDSIAIDSFVLSCMLDACKYVQYKPLNDTLLLLKESCTNIEKEMDFHIEFENMLMFQRMVAESGQSDAVVVPRPYPKLCRKRVLVMEYVKGNPPSSRVPDAETTSVKLMTFFVTCLLKHGVLHADPHAGNIAVTNDQRIVLYDFGLVAKYDVDMRSALNDIVIGTVSKDVDTVVDTLLKSRVLLVNRLNKSHVTIDDLNAVEYMTLYRLVTYVVEYSRSLNVNKLRSSILKDDLLNANNRILPVSVNPDMLLLFKTFTTLEGVCKTMYPDFNYFMLSQTMMTHMLSVETLTKKMSIDVDKMKKILVPPVQESGFPDYKTELRDMEHERKHNVFVSINVIGILVNLLGMM